MNKRIREKLNDRCYFKHYRKWKRILKRKILGDKDVSGLNKFIIVYDKEV